MMPSPSPRSNKARPGAFVEMLPAKVIVPALDDNAVPPPPDVIVIGPRMMLLPDSLVMVPSLAARRLLPLRPSLLVRKLIVAGRSIGVPGVVPRLGSRCSESLLVLVAIET